MEDVKHGLFVYFPKRFLDNADIVMRAGIVVSHNKPYCRIKYKFGRGMSFWEGRTEDVIPFKQHPSKIGGHTQEGNFKELMKGVDKEK